MLSVIRQPVSGLFAPVKRAAMTVLNMEDNLEGESLEKTPNTPSILIFADVLAGDGAGQL